ncbi:antifreeze protein [Rhodocollybia butyracea]|uniref:Antifreeze protein n=1 Tax=Rhodocollybia butyracea TaxID=206335 RepID=A0A9P5PG93_9AGAR|nr:antifreeze protein [Rhodocollybia butyracea]
MLSTVNKAVCLSLWCQTAAINLGTAGNFAILAQSGISTVPASSITGNIGVSPAAGSFLTGFSLTLSSTGVFATSIQVVGEIFAASYSAPTPVTLTTAVANMQTAYTNGVGLLNPGFTNLASGSLSGLVLTPGSINGLHHRARVTLVGVLASNVFWVVASGVTAGSGSHVEGVILGKTAVTLQTGATMNGRILAQTFVALQQATVVG